MSESLVTVRKEGGALCVTLNRPEVLNALDFDLLEALERSLTRAAADSEVRAVMLTGQGRGFCAGADLAAVAIDEGIPVALERHFNPVARLLLEMPKPVVAAVNGVAAGAGMSLALACDVRLLSDRASFALGFTRIGLVLDASCSYFLPRLVGRGRSFELAYSGRRVEAPEALALGLGERLLEGADFHAQAWAYVKSLAAGPTVSFALVKEQLNRSDRNDLERQLDLEIELQGRAAATRDAREGVEAFVHKRPPEFRGD